MKLFSIRDSKALGYNRPFCSETEGTACREVATGLRNDNNMIEFASDFALYEIGDFAQESGKLLVDDEHPKFITEIGSLVEIAKEE